MEPNPADRGAPRWLRALPVAALSVAVCLALFGEQGVVANRELSARIDGMRQEVAEVERANATLRTEIRTLREDPRAVERLARSELNLVRDGELVFEFTGPAGGAAMANAAPGPAPAAPAPDGAPAP